MNASSDVSKMITSLREVCENRVWPPGCVISAERYYIMQRGQKGKLPGPPSETLNKRVVDIINPTLQQYFGSESGEIVKIFIIQGFGYPWSDSFVKHF